MIERRVAILIAACLVLSAGVVWLVVSGEGRLLTLLVYLAALGSGIGAIRFSRSGGANTSSVSIIQRGDLPMLGGLMLLQLIGLIYMSTFPFHYVQDEFITGYTTYMLPSIPEIEWFAGYPAPGEWIAGFPILYYALQKPFIEVLGLSLETIRISTWPYHLLSAALVYLIGKEFFQRQTWAVVAAINYIVLAPNLYMAGYGMHNISSTFFFLAAFYAAILMVREERGLWVIFCGLFSTMAYLTYTSSYLTLPLIAVFIGFSALFHRSLQPLARFGLMLLIVTVGLTPFLTHALTNHNYFTERGDQVNAIAAIYQSDEEGSPASELASHIRTNIESLYTSGIGGVTDYWFGHQSLFDWMTLTLLVLGIGIALARGVRDRNALELGTVAVVLTTFVFGMLLTLPAGGFHRTSLAFPFVALLIALALRTIIEGVPWLAERPRIQVAGTGLLVITFILINISTLQTMTAEDEQISGLTDSVPITSYIEGNVPDGGEIIISAFPNYHLERELIVRTGDVYDVRIQSFDEAIEHAGDTVIVLFQPPNDQTHRLEARYGGGEFVEEWDGYELRRHLIWVPE